MLPANLSAKQETETTDRIWRQQHFIFFASTSSKGI